MKSVVLNVLLRLILLGAVVVGVGLLLEHTDRSSPCKVPASGFAAPTTTARPTLLPRGKGVDCAVARWTLRNKSSIPAGPARAFALLGTTLGALVVVSVIGTGIWGERGTLFQLVILTVAWVGAEAVARMAGLIVDRKPSYRLTGLGTGGPAFPAHHVLVGTAVLLALAAVLVGGGWFRSHRPVTWGSATVVILLLAAGQLRLGGHSLTDVGVGLAAGVAWVLLLLPPIARLVRARGRREPFPSAQAAVRAIRRFTDDAD